MKDNKPFKPTLWKFFSGQSILTPAWMNKLPDFIRSSYEGNGKFKWLGMTFYDNKLNTWGETIFSIWKMRREERKKRRKKGDR